MTHAAYIWHIVYENDKKYRTQYGSLWYTAHDSFLGGTLVFDTYTLLSFTQKSFNPTESLSCYTENFHLEQQPLVRNTIESLFEIRVYNVNR